MSLSWRKLAAALQMTPGPGCWAGLGGVGTCVQAALSLSQLWPHTRHFYKLCSHLLQLYTLSDTGPLLIIPQDRDKLK